MTLATSVAVDLSPFCLIEEFADGSKGVCVLCWNDHVG